MRLSTLTLVAFLATVPAGCGASHPAGQTVSGDAVVAPVKDTTSSKVKSQEAVEANCPSKPVNHGLSIALVRTGASFTVKVCNVGGENVSKLMLVVHAEAKDSIDIIKPISASGDSKVSDGQPGQKLMFIKSLDPGSSATMQIAYSDSIESQGACVNASFVVLTSGADSGDYRGRQGCFTPNGFTDQAS